MNIDKWLADTISSIKTADPSELMRKMEEYGLVEDDRDAFCGAQGILSQVSISHNKHGYFVAESEHMAELISSPESVVFTVAPRKAASNSLYINSSIHNTDWQFSMSQAA